MFNDYLLGEAFQDEEVRLLGVAGEPGRPSPFTGVIERIRHEDLGSTGADVLTSNLQGEQGQSGALAYSRRGVIGMYIGASDGGGSRVLSAAAIRDAARDAGVPFVLNENEFYDCRRSRPVCATMASHSLRASLELRNVFTDQRATLGPGECGPVFEGRYAVQSGARHIACEPRLLRVPAGKESLRFNVTCELDLSTKRWQSSLGSLSCMGRGSGQYDCFGFQDSGLGVFYGVASVRAARVRLLGAFTSPDGSRTGAEAELDLDDTGQLRGRLLPKGGTATEITLKQES